MTLEAYPLQKDPELEEHLRSQEAAQQQPLNSEVFADFPTTKVSLVGTDKKGRTIYVRVNSCGIEKGCNCCKDPVEAEFEHVVTRVIIPGSKQKNYTRMHLRCFQDKIIDTLDSVSVVSSDQTTHEELEKKQETVNKQIKATRVAPFLIGSGRPGTKSK